MARLFYGTSELRARLFAFVSRTKRVLPWLWPVALTIILAAREAYGDRTWWSVPLMRISEPAWPLIAGVILMILLIRRRKGLAPAGCALAIGLFSLHPCWGQPGEPKGIKVLQLNMEHGLAGVDRVASLIAREAPDVICLEEAGPLSYFPNRAPESLRNALAGYRMYHSQFEAIAVKGHIRSGEIIPLDEVSSEKAWYDQKVITSVVAEIGGRDYRIAAVHFSPRAAGGPLIKTYSEFSQTRQSQHEALFRFIEKHREERIIAAGDFNGQPIGPNYRLMRSAATDCYARAARGFGYTLRPQIRHKRVDYIFVRNLKPNACFVLNDVVSDHLAVVAWVE